MSLKSLFYQILPALILWVLLSCNTAYSQDLGKILTQKDTFNFSGVVKARDSREPLIGASVSIGNASQGTVTDENGFFSLDLPEGNSILQISYIGYETGVFQVTLQTGNAAHVFQLEPKINFLEEVQVSDAARDENVTSLDLGARRLSVQSIKQLPGLLGEADVLRSLQTLPGVTTVGEGATGFNVRGGNIDQNLVLLDNIPIFNTGHLLGLFSVFNPDMVSTVNFYRGGTPANFGGRTASVLDIGLREPGGDHWRYQAGLGLFTGRLSAEGPIVDKKLFFMGGLRAAFPRYLFKYFPSDQIRNSNAAYTDFSAKIRWVPTENDQVTISTYLSTDAFNLAGDSLACLEINATSTEYHWTTTGANLRWTHSFDENRLFYTSLTWSDYRPGFTIPSDDYAAEYTSGIRQLTQQGAYRWTPDRHQASIGWQLNHYRVNPGRLEPASERSPLNLMELPLEYGIETAAFVNDEWAVSDRFSLMLGLRFAWYGQLGPGSAYEYLENQPKDETSRLEEPVLFTGNQLMQSYQGLEPRLAFNWTINDKTAFKGGYHRLFQYLQLLSNTTAALPIDRWKLSDRYLQPQKADQFSAGIFRNLENNNIEVSLEAYYRLIENQPDYRSGVNLILLDGVETAVLQGQGRALGLEWSLRRKKGRFNGWMSYTWSKAILKIDSPYPEDQLFTKDWYPASFNRPHVANVVLNYRQNRRVTLSANFNFSSGRPATFPKDRYLVAGLYLPNYVDRNLERIPDYHRLDLGLTIDNNPYSESRWKSRWAFSLYNVYARRNAYSIFFRTVDRFAPGQARRARAYRFSVLGSIIPSVTYELTLE